MKKKYPREKNLTDKAIDFLNEQPGCIAVKRHGSVYGTGGLADVQVTYRGLAGELETKKRGKKPEGRQLYYRVRFRAAGAVWMKADSMADVDRFWEVLCSKARRLELL